MKASRTGLRRCSIADDARLAVFEGLWPHMIDAQDTMFRDISDDERQAFLGTLQKMLRNIRKHEF